MKILLVVDLQPEFKDKFGAYNRVLDFVKSEKDKDYDFVIATMCYNSPNSPFVKYRNWDGCLKGCEPLEFVPDIILPKDTYGLPDYKALNPVYTYDVVGCNTDACVLKVALDLFDRGYDFRVLTSYCFSATSPERHQIGVELMKHLMSDAVILESRE